MEKIHLINIQEVWVLRREYGLNPPTHIRITPPYPHCVLTYKPLGSHVVLIDVLEEKNEIFIRSYIHADGETTYFSEAICTNVISNDFKISHSYEDDAKNIAEEATGIAIFSLNLMNCKNIKYILVDPNKTLSRQVKRQMKRKNTEPYLKYENLEIQPVKERNIYRSYKANEKAETRLHTVRGHFKTFTEERPLFGKLTGTYWWGDCIKGNPELGAIEKDYTLMLRPEDLKTLSDAVN